MVFMKGQRMKDLLLRAPVVVRTSNMKISRRCLADYVKTLNQKACCTCSTIIFLHSTNEITDLWRCRWRCRRQILNSLLMVQMLSKSKQKTSPQIFLCTRLLHAHKNNNSVTGDLTISVLFSNWVLMMTVLPKNTLLPCTPATWLAVHLPALINK